MHNKVHSVVYMHDNYIQNKGFGSSDIGDAINFDNVDSKTHGPARGE